METFADYILNELDYDKKIEMIYVLAKKTKIFFDKSVVFKTDIAKMFIESMQINVDKNLCITASLLYACKKPLFTADKNELETYPKKSADFLLELGFPMKFCKICEGHNRKFSQNENEKREKESDILELVDQFGGMIMDRPDRKAFEIDEAMYLLENRNLIGKKNIYLELFKTYISREKKVV